MSLFADLPLTRPARAIRPAAGPVNAAPLLSCPPCRPSRAAVERTLLELYPLGQVGAARVAELLEVPPTSAYVALTLNALGDARRVMAYRGRVPFSDVARLASEVLA